MTYLAFNIAQVYRLQAGQRLAFVAIRWPRRLRERKLGTALAVIYVAGCYGVFSLEDLLCLLGTPSRESLLPALSKSSSSDDLFVLLNLLHPDLILDKNSFDHMADQARKRGLLVRLGMGLYWLTHAWRADAVSNAACAHLYCHVSGIETSLLVIYLFYGVVLVLLDSVIISLLSRLVMKYSQRTPFDGP